MFHDARDIPTDTVLDCDVCIVGAGFAGIAAACEFDGTPWKVILLESGGRKLDPLTQDLHRGTTLRPGHGALHIYRERRFGGTSHVWGGRCYPFDAIDMEYRDWVEHSGWPVTREELDPYYARAYDYCDLGRYGLTLEELLPPDAQKQMVPGLASDVVKTDRLWLFSLPTKFAKKFNEQLARSTSVHVYLHANCLSLETDPDGGRVEHVEVASLNKNHFRIRAGQFILAMGGLETTRLLMLSDRHHPGGIGNAHGHLGRFYISHVTGNAGQVRFTPSGPLVWDYERTIDGVYCRRAFRIDEKVQREQKLLNFRAILDFPEISDPSHGLAILSAMYLAKRFLVRRIPPEYSVQLSGMSQYRHIWRHMRNCVLGLPALLAFAWRWLWKRVLARRKLPSVMLHNRQQVYNLHFDAEQSPNRESRVFLGEERDAFGQRRLVVDWSLTPQDARSVLDSIRIIAAELERCNVGSMEIDEDEMLDRIARSGVGSHHIGTTRMAAKPEHGVVDQDCRVFGVSNLFIASSSTFPTGGCANPTLTIVAMALRVVDHLKKPQWCGRHSTPCLRISGHQASHKG